MTVNFDPLFNKPIAFLLVLGVDLTLRLAVAVYVVAAKEILGGMVLTIRKIAIAIAINLLNFFIFPSFFILLYKVSTSLYYHREEKIVEKIVEKNQNLR